MSLINEALKRASQETSGQSAQSVQPVSPGETECGRQCGEPSSVRASSPLSPPLPVPQPSPAPRSPSGPMPGASVGRGAGRRSWRPTVSLSVCMLMLTAVGWMAFRLSEGSRPRPVGASPAELPAVGEVATLGSTVPRTGKVASAVGVNTPALAEVDIDAVTASWAPQTELSRATQALVGLTDGDAAQVGTPRIEPVISSNSPDLSKSDRPSNPLPIVEAAVAPSAVLPAGDAELPADLSAGVAQAAAPPASQPTEVLSGIAKFRLTGVIRSGEVVMASINGRMMQVGDSYDGLKIVQINARSVEVELGGQRYTLGL